MPIYYTTYSAVIDGGSMTGRSEIKCEKPMNCMNRIAEVEASILAAVHTHTPTARNLYLTFWCEIDPDPTPQ